MEIDGIPCIYNKEYDETYFVGFPPYGNLPEKYKNVRIPAKIAIQKEGCSWRINGEKCGKKCINLFTYYCQEHKDIPDIKRIIHEPLTICRKRKSTYLICDRIE